LLDGSPGQLLFTNLKKRYNITPNLLSIFMEIRTSGKSPIDPRAILGPLDEHEQQACLDDERQACLDASFVGTGGEEYPRPAHWPPGATDTTIGEVRDDFLGALKEATDEQLSELTLRD
jgi:hypothetical protein